MRRLPLVAFGALVVATVGAFFVTQHIKVKTPLFTGVRRSPAAISPLHGAVCGAVDHRVADISFYLQHRSDDVSVYVIDESGNIVRTLATGVHMRGGANPVRKHFYWDGRTDDGRVAPDGKYYLRIALLGQGRTIDQTALPITVKDTLPRPTVTGVSPAVAAPGAPVQISYTDDHRSGTVLIYKTDLPDWWRRPVAKVIGTKWNHNSVVWDGLIRGRPAPSGTYLVGFAMTDQACNKVQFPARLPPAQGSTPHAGVTIRNLAVEPTVSPHPAGQRAFVLVDSRGHGYTWALQRAGARKPASHGVATRPLMHVRLPRSSGAGLYALSVHSDGHRTAVPLVASAAGGAAARAKVLVVLPMLTWQGQNLVDDDGDGVPNTLDVGAPVRISRPFANGLPRDFADVAAFLAYLDRAHLPYELTTDVALANGVGPGLRGRRAVVFAGNERWLPGSLSALVRAFAQNGGNVLSLGIDSLRRTVTISDGVALSPSPPGATDIFGARIGSVAPRGGQLILVLHDGLGIFTTTSQAFPGYNSFQPIGIPAATGATAASGTASPTSSAGTSTSTATIVGFKNGRGTIVEIGLPGFGTSLAHNVDSQELVRQLWTVLGR